MATPRPVHTLEVLVGEESIDDLGHASNLEYLRWVVAAAEDHSAAVGYGFDAYRALGSIFVVRRHEIDYLLPARAGDRVLVSTWVEEFRGASSVRCADLHRAGDGAVLARAQTTWAFVSLATGRPGRIPAELADRFR